MIIQLKMPILKSNWEDWILALVAAASPGTYSRPMDRSVASAAAAVMIMTMLATLIIPLQFAVFAGVGFSILLHVIRSSNQIHLVQLVPVEGGFPMEADAPAKLPSNEMTVRAASAPSRMLWNMKLTFLSGEAGQSLVRLRPNRNA